MHPPQPLHPISAIGGALSPACGGHFSMVAARVEACRNPDFPLALIRPSPDSIGGSAFTFMQLPRRIARPRPCGLQTGQSQRHCSTAFSTLAMVGIGVGHADVQHARLPIASVCHRSPRCRLCSYVSIRLHSRCQALPAATSMQVVFASVMLFLRTSHKNNV